MVGKIKKETELHKDIRENPKSNIFTGIMLVLTVAAFLFNLWAQTWSSVFFTALIFLVILLPKIIERYSDLNIPSGIEVLSTVFVVISLFFGTLDHFYADHLWWDIIVHVWSGIFFCFIGFLTLYVLLGSDRVNKSPFVIVVFAFAFSLAIGGIWEIYEFAGDELIGTHMQGGTLSMTPNLTDTMKDLIDDAIGAIVASTMIYVYLKRRKGIIVKGMVKELKKDNPKLFHKKR